MAIRGRSGVRAVAVMVAAWWMSTTMAWAGAPAAAAQRGGYGGHGSAAVHGANGGATVHGGAAHGAHGAHVGNAQAHAHKGGKDGKPTKAEAQHGAKRTRAVASAPHTARIARSAESAESAKPRKGGRATSHVEHRATAPTKSSLHDAPRTSRQASTHQHPPKPAASRSTAAKLAVPKHAPKHAPARPNAVRPLPHHKLVVEAPATQVPRAIPQPQQLPPILG